MNCALLCVVSSGLITLLSEPASAQRLTYPETKLIYSLKLPPGWFRGQDEGGGCGCGGVPVYRNFYLRGTKKTVGFYIKIPGLRSTVAYSSALRDILAKPPHDLDAEEQTLVHLDDEENYIYRSRRTMYISKRRVLVAERRSIRDSSLEMLIRVGNHHDNNGDSIYDVVFSAPAKLYPVYLPEFKKALDTIYWWGGHGGVISQ